MANNEETGRRDARRGSHSNSRRVEEFHARGAITARIVTRSGDVVVRAHEGDQVKVSLRSSGSQYDHLLDNAVIDFDEATGDLEIRSRASERVDSLRDLKGVFERRSWFDFGNSDLDVELIMPANSSVDVTTVSGDVTVQGEVDRVKVGAVSGDVSIEDRAREVDLSTASGDLVTGDVVDTLRCKTASGDVRSSGTAASTEIASASGDVKLTARQAGDLVVKAVSGDVRVDVARGLAVDVNGNTVSGDLGSNIDLDAQGDGASDDEVIFIKVTTVSGDVWIARAS